MTINEFFESTEKLAIHCDTKEKAERLIKRFNTAYSRKVMRKYEGYKK